MMKYIEAEHEKDLVGFKYRGGTSSITYQYLWSPLAEKLLLYIPVWVAPNLITLVAFIIVVVSHLLFFFVQEDQLGAAVPVWKLMLFGITMFVYQHLDNIDGKQARRTGTSSPVGMLFDHGADALTGVIFAMQIGRVLHLSSSQYTIYAICFQIMIPNFFALLLQYSVGEFKLDRINPIDQGIPAYTLLAFAGCFIDFSFWDTPHWFANYNEEFLLLFGVVIVFILYNSCKNVFKDSIRQKSDVAQKAWLPVILITFLLVMKVLGLVWIYHKHYFVVVYWLTFFWSRNMMLIQVCYVTKQVYQVWNWSTLFFCLASMGSLVVAVKSPQSMGSYLFAVCLVQCSFLCEFIFSFLKQSTTILKIKLLKIPYRQTKQ